MPTTAWHGAGGGRSLSIPDAREWPSYTGVFFLHSPGRWKLLPCQVL